MKFAFAGQDEKDLFTKEAMQEICNFEQDVVMTSNHYYGSDDCRGLSLGYLVGLLAGQKHCLELTEEDVTETLALIEMCAPLINSAYDNVSKEECNHKIYNHNIIYVITQFLVDSEFLQNGNTKVTYTLLMHTWYSFDTLEFYRENVENDPFAGTYVELVGFGSDIKYDLFNIYITEDLYLFIIAIVSILLLMVLYLRSLTVTIATLFDIAFSFVMSYFFYHIVFRLKFFPFMNLLSGLVLIAVGADDVFVFTDIWLQEKAHFKEEHGVKALHSGDLCTILIKTFKHASLSIFVTSLSTASAFLANMVSEITSIRCFGLFSALCIICNFVFMITWVPAVIVLMDKINQFIWKKMNSGICCKRCQECLDKVEKFLSKVTVTVYERFFPFIMEKLWMLWIIISILLGIGGFVVVFAVPKFSLPTSEEFQFFESSNPMEMYDLKLKPKFHFFNEGTQSDSGLSVSYVFGVVNEDNGNHFDPDSTGSLTLDTDISFSNPAVIDFLTIFCEDVLKALFISSRTRNQGICSLGRMRDVVTLSCSDFNPFERPCCGQTWPLSGEDFDICVTEFVSQLGHRGYEMLGIPYFDPSGEKIEAITISFESNQTWTPTFSTMEDLFDQTKDFLEDHKLNGSKMMKNAFVDFHGGLEFYDLQKALSQGTYLAIGISLACALIVMLLSTRNVLLSLYAILSITLAIVVTIGVLVLLGWELNILESVAITLAVGLSIDFTIHYGVAYMISKSTKRSEKVKSSFKTVGSAVFMAALTTFVAGASVVSSRVLSYSRLGTFLMLVMTFSWVYATFMFQSLCHIFGPEGSFMQIPNPFRCHSKTNMSKSSDEDVKRSKTTNIGVNSSSVSLSKKDSQNDFDGVDNPAYMSETALEVKVKTDSTSEAGDIAKESNEYENVGKDTLTSHL